MREVEASRFVAATPDQLQRRLTPETVIAAEGSFTVRDVHEHVGEEDKESEGSGESAEHADGDATDVVVGGPGIEFTLRFTELENGWYYTKVGEAAPIDHLETWITVEPEDEGSRVTMRSTVAVGLSIPFIDRIAGWKRRGEMKRALKTLAADVS